MWDTSSSNQGHRGANGAAWCLHKTWDVTLSNMHPEGSRKETEERPEEEENRRLHLAAFNTMDQNSTCFTVE